MTRVTTDVSGDELMARVETEAPSRDRIVDRIDPRLVRLLTVLGFGLPLIGYLWLLVRYSVNTMYADQWSDVTVIKQSYAQFFPLSLIHILAPNAAVAFVKSSGARFLLSDCNNHVDLSVALAPIVRSVHHFGCATVYEVKPGG